MSVFVVHESDLITSCVEVLSIILLSFTLRLLSALHHQFYMRRRSCTVTFSECKHCYPFLCLMYWLKLQFNIQLPETFQPFQWFSSRPIDHIRISCVCLSSVCFHPWFCVPPCRLGSPSVRFQYETERRFKQNVHYIICRAPSAKCEDYQTPPELGQTSSTWTHISVHTVLWATLSDLQICGGEVEVERRNFCSAVLQRKF